MAAVDAASSDVPSDPEETETQQLQLETQLDSLQQKHPNLDHQDYLDTAFALIDNYIASYKLNKTDSLLDRIQSQCEKVKNSKYHVKFVQAKAFCRWKQYRFNDALHLFHIQEKMVGPSPALCENIGHTYSSINQLTKAEEYFERALKLIEQGHDGNKGGLLLGLGLLRERMGNVQTALPFLQQALDHYTNQHKKADSSSIIAKAHMGVGKAHEKLGDFPNAEIHFSSAVLIFKKTVGDSSPLTAHSLGALGRIRIKRGNIEEGAALTLAALKLEVEKDAFHLDSVWELLNRLKDVHTEAAQKRTLQFPNQPHVERLRALHQAFAPLIALAHAADARITSLPTSESTDVGTLAVFYKTAGEVCMLAQDAETGKHFLRTALDHFHRVQGFDCSSLINGCNELLQMRM